MITIPIAVFVDNDSNGVPKGEAPYTFTYSSNNSNCTTFSNVTGNCTFNGTYYVANTDVIYVNQTCIGTSLISCTIVDANGCSVTKSPLTINDPCDIQTSISTNGEFVFVATTTGGDGDYTYTWSYDTQLFTKQVDDTDEEDNYLSLKLRAYETLPISTVVSLLVTDSQGCTKTANYTYNFCKPTTSDIRLNLVCGVPTDTICTGNTSYYKQLDLEPYITLCSGQTIDWSTLTLGIPSGLCITKNGSVIKIASTNSIGISQIVNWSVKTTAGVRSTVSQITVGIPICTNVSGFAGIPQTNQITADYVVSDVITIDVESRVAGTPNWATFTFTNTPSFGTVTFNANREIEYEITDITTTPTIPDVIKWSLNDYDGNQINITDTILRDVIAVPVTVGEIICLTCGETSAPIDVLANDTGDIDRSTLTVTLVDPDILITKDGDNNLIFTVLPIVSTFSNTNQYKVANTQGAFSATANAVVATACSGIPNDFDLTCEVSKTFDLYDRFSGVLGLNSNITETTTTAPTYTTQGGSIVNPTSTGTVDFTSIATGRTYTFQLATENTASCPGVFDYQEVEIYHGVTPHLTFGTAVDNGDSTIYIPFTYSGLATGLTVTLNGSAAAFVSSPILSGGTGNFTIFGTTGVQTIVASASTICGNIVTDSDNSITL